MGLLALSKASISTLGYVALARASGTSWVNIMIAATRLVVGSKRLHRLAGSNLYVKKYINSSSNILSSQQIRWEALIKATTL